MKFSPPTRDACLEVVREKLFGRDEALTERMKMVGMESPRGLQGRVLLRWRLHLENLLSMVQGRRFQIGHSLENRSLNDG